MKEIFLEKHEGINDVYMMKAKNTGLVKMYIAHLSDNHNSSSFAENALVRLQ